MPELPEVEVVKKSLSNKVKNLIIKKIIINDHNLRYPLYLDELNRLIGLRVKKILRRSKLLLFIFEKNIVMLVHLGMTGKFFFINKKKIKYKTSFYYNLDEEKDKKYNRVIFTLSDRQKLIYNDVRKFGFIKIINKLELWKNFHLKNLGPEPLNRNFNFKYFKKYLLKKKRTIKDILMDQRFVSGLGNIYANEILYICKIKPTRKTYSLKDKDIKNIILQTKKILKRAIYFGGSSLKDFSSSDGKKGKFQDYFNVYGKKGGNCSNKNCKGIITKIFIGNRATFYCNRCQK